MKSKILFQINRIFNLYFERLNEESVFMGNSLEEGRKHLQHNKQRYISAVLALSKYVLGKKMTILDIGTSPFTVFLKKMYPKCEIITIDLTSKFAIKMKKLKINFYKVNLNRQTLLSLGKKFDVIFFLEVIEHLKKDHGEILRQIEGILKPGGICIIQTPNRKSLKNTLIKKPGFGGFITKLTDKPSSLPGDIHYKEYTKEEFKKLVTESTHLDLIKENHTLYFDSPSSALAYRSHKLLSFPLIIANLFLVSVFSTFRIGMQFILKKMRNGG